MSLSNNLLEATHWWCGLRPTDESACICSIINLVLLMLQTGCRGDTLCIAGKNGRLWCHQGNKTEIVENTTLGGINNNTGLTLLT